MSRHNHSMNLVEAVDIIARHVIAHAAKDIAGDDWDLYYEIDEYDWAAIVSRAIALNPYPDKERYETAYDYLTKRAGEAS